MIEKPVIVGDSVVMQTLRRRLEKVGRVDAPVLINGESGTGKELAAAAIHRASGRASGPLITVDCGALPPGLVHAELFGYEKGAFTGAQSARKGLLEEAHGGTIFLDEIGDLPLELQTNLLRFLQEKTICRVGTTRKVPVNARVIAATHVDLEAAVREGRFREDLYYRLRVLHLTMPPLRDRSDDIALLARHFFSLCDEEKSPQVRDFSPAAMAAMEAHHWPGNVREMINRIRHAAVMCDGVFMEPEDLGLAAHAGDAPELGRIRAHAERDAIENGLRKSGHNVSRAARELGVSRVTLYRLMQKHRIAGRSGVPAIRPMSGASVGMRRSRGDL